MRLTVLLSVAWVLLTSLPAHAALQGVSLYERGDYARARRALERDLRSKKLSEQERIKARLYLAASLYALGAEENARVQLEELALTARDLKVDPILFPPDFVAMAEQARERVELQRQEAELKRQAAERERLEAERKLQEAEQKRLEEEARAKNPPPPPDESEPEVAPRALSLRPEVFGFVAPLGETKEHRGVGLGAAFNVALGSLDLGARVLLGDNPALGAEVGWLLGDGSVRPRVALRATAIPGLDGSVGGGAVVGLRLATSRRLSFLVDVGGEYFKFGEGISNRRPFVLTSSVGVGFELL